MFIGAEFLLDREFNIIEMNNAVMPMYENNANFFDIVFEEDKALVAHFFENPTNGMQIRVYYENQIYWVALSIEEKGIYYKVLLINIDSMKKNFIKLKTNEKLSAMIDEFDTTTRFIYNRETDSFEKLMLLGVDYSNRTMDQRFIDGFTKIIHSEDVQSFKGLIDALRTAKSEFSYKLRFLTNETYDHCKIEGNVVKIKDEPVKVIGVLYNNSQEEKEKEVLRKDAILDPLTGLLNKKVSEEYIRKALQEAKNNNDLGMRTLLIIDVDNFKMINDTYGHMVGDNILTEVAHMLNECNEGAIVGRFGGDEFILFIDNLTNETEIRAFCKNICESFEEIGREHNIQLSATIGLSSYPQNADNYEMLFKQADRGLYRGKKKGRNCYIIYSKEKHGEVSIASDSISNYNEVKDFYLEREVAKNLFITNIIERIGRSTSMKSLYEILNLVLERYQLDSIEMIMVENHISKHYATIYAKDLEEYHTDRYFPPEMEKEYLNLFNSEGEFISRRIYDIVESNEKLGIMLHDKFNIRATIQSKNTISEDTYGIVSFNMNTKRRLWTNEEVQVLTLVGRILGEFFLGKSKIDKLSQKRDLDQLTGITSFYKFLSELKEIGIDSNHSVICLDVIDFKSINRAFSYSKGDDILKSIARNISKNLKESEYVARISDDRFVMYYESKDLEERLNNILRRIRMENIKIGNIDFTVGVYHISNKEEDIMICIDRANLARRNRGVRDKEIVYFDKRDEEREIRAKEFENSMSNGLKNKEFKVYYQPLYNIEKDECISCEALVRWIKNGELISPGEFIPVFENSNQILQLDLYIFEQVLSDISDWKKRGIKPVPVGINLSRLHIYEDDFIPKIDALRVKYDIDPSLIVLEITESAYVSKTGRVGQFIKDLRQRGYVVALDDFGSGYTALTTLASVVVDCIKIDMDLVKGDNINKELVIKTMVSLAESLNAKVVTEGVETIEQRDSMKSLGVKIVQGYYYSKAIPKSDFETKYLKAE